MSCYEVFANCQEVPKDFDELQSEYVFVFSVILVYMSLVSDYHIDDTLYGDS